MTKFKLLNEETLKEGFDFLAKKEPGFKKVLEEKNYERNIKKNLAGLSPNYVSKKFIGQGVPPSFPESSLEVLSK